MAKSGRGHVHLTFGPFAFDPRTLELRRDDVHVRLPPKPSRALDLLLRNAGSLVTRQELHEHVWPDTVIEFDQGLNTCMRHLRACLEDDAEAPTFIETVPRRGYRFIAPVTSTSIGRSPRSRRPWPVLAAGVVALLGIAWLSRGDASDPEPLRLAVLPLQTIGGSAEDSLFAEGVTEELLTTLAGADPDRLQVLARTSAYRIATDFTLLEMRERLDIDFVLQGRVRKEVGGYKITAQLVDTQTSAAAWSGEQRYATDAASVPAQEALANVVTAGLTGLLGGALGVEPQPQPAGAVTTPWRVARHLVATGGASEREQALQLLGQVLDLEPDFVPAHSAMARALVDLNRLDSAQIHIRGAIERFGPAPELLLERGRLHLRQWRLEEAGRDLAEAVVGAARDGRAHHTLAYYLAVVGRHDDALAAMAIAEEFDPVSASVVGDAGLFAYWAGRPEEALRQCRSIEPYVLPEHRLMLDRCLFHNYVAAGDLRAAVVQAQKVLEAGGAPEALRREIQNDSSAEAALARYYVWAAEPANLPSSQGGTTAYRAALAAAGAKDVEAALTALEVALREREPRLIEIGVERRLDPLRGHPRFEAVARAVGVDA